MGLAAHQGYNLAVHLRSEPQNGAQQSARCGESDIANATSRRKFQLLPTNAAVIAQAHS